MTTSFIQNTTLRFNCGATVTIQVEVRRKIPYWCIFIYTHKSSHFRRHGNASKTLLWQSIQKLAAINILSTLEIQSSVFPSGAGCGRPPQWSQEGLMGKLRAQDEGLDHPLSGHNRQAQLPGPLLLILRQAAVPHHQRHALVQHTVQVSCQHSCNCQETLNNSTATII